MIPCLLEMVDMLKGGIVERTTISTRAVYNSFLQVLETLREWELSLQHEIGTPFYTPASRYYGPSATLDLDEQMRPSIDRSLLFPDVSSANAFTHCWAFQIICLLQVHSLVNSGSEELTEYDVLHGRNYYDVIEELSTMICQSMDYLMQEKMKLYGPASTFFPLKTAYRAFKLGTPQTSEHIDWCRKIIERLVSKGLKIIVTFFEDDISV